MENICLCVGSTLSKGVRLCHLWSLWPDAPHASTPPEPLFTGAHQGADLSLGLPWRWSGATSPKLGTAGEEGRAEPEAAAQGPPQPPALLSPLCFLLSHEIFIYARNQENSGFFFLSDHFIPWFSIGKCFRYPQNPNFYTFHLVVSLKFLFRNAKVMDGLSASVLCHVSPEEMRLECSSDWGWRWEWGASWRMGRGGRRQASENTDEKPHSFGQRQNKI